MLAGAEPTLVKEEVQISELLQVAARGILITYPNFKDRLLIYCDFDDKFLFDNFKILNVLGNILGNSCQAILNTEGSITLRAALFDGRLRIEVENIGPFIPPEHLPKIFDQFFTSGKAGATGLGLAILKKLSKHMAEKLCVLLLFPLLISAWSSVGYSLGKSQYFVTADSKYNLIFVF